MKSKSMDRFLYDRDLHHERIKGYKDKEAYLEPNQTFAKISRALDTLMTMYSFMTVE